MLLISIGIIKYHDRRYRQLDETYILYLKDTTNNALFSKKTNPKITILEILIQKTQAEITKFKIFTRFDFIIIAQLSTWPCNKVETRKDFRFYYFWLYFVYQNLQNGYFGISLLTILFDVICGKWMLSLGDVL